MNLPVPPERPPLVMIVSGPAGIGKTTVCEQLLREFSQLRRLVTATTRSPRPGETDGIDYHFFSREDFARDIEQGAFFEHATVHGNQYGTLRRTIFKTLDAGHDLLLNIDVQGARAFQEATREEPRIRGRLFSLFLLPSSLEELRERMNSRGQDSAENIERRLETARREIELAPLYDYRMTSESRKSDYDRVRAVYIAEQLRVRET